MQQTRRPHRKDHARQVQLIHDALPELAVQDVDLTTPLRVVVLVHSDYRRHDRGVDRADIINREGFVGEELNMGSGSATATTSRMVRRRVICPRCRPNAYLSGNIGVVQATKADPARIEDMVGATGVNALAIHLNPAMEVIQPEGDTDFRGCLDTIARLNERLKVPVIAKETGCGLSRRVGERLVEIGVKHVDVSGAGGTSWVGVETLRAKAKTRELGELFWDWGIPTGASIASLADLDLEIVATGGVRNGLDITRAIALGATAGGIARIFLQAWNDGGRDAVLKSARGVIDEIRLAHLLSGCQRPAEMRQSRIIVGADLARWVPTGSSLRERIGQV